MCEVHTLHLRFFFFFLVLHFLAPEDFFPNVCNLYAL